MRFARTDWLDLGMRLLRDCGAAVITVERLTAEAQKTRGSFYHHFADRAAFVSDMMARWRQSAVEERMAKLPANGNIESLRAFLRSEPFFADHRLERALRQLAVSEPVVAMVLADVDRIRVAGLATLIAKLRPEVEDAPSEAFVQYAAMVGSQWLIDDPDDSRLPAIKRAAYRIFGLT